MAKLETVTVEVKLSNNFKEFITLFTDTLETLTALNDLVKHNIDVISMQDYKAIVLRMESIAKRGKKVNYGES